MTEAVEKTEDYEELFAHRFTSEDREYQEYLKRPPDPPPIVENWRGRGGGTHRGGWGNRYQDRRGWGERDLGGEHGPRGERGKWQDRDWDRDRSYRGERDRDRERSWGTDRGRGYRGGYKPYPQGSGQNYTVRPQRSQYDPY